MTLDGAAFDVAVVGGGITGMSAALQLADGGARVAIFDAARNAGSNANAGSLHVQLQSRFLRLFPEQAPNVEASLPLYLAAVRRWDTLDQRLGGVEMSRRGGLMLAETPDQLAFLHEKAEREAAKGLNVDILSRDALESLAPWLGSEVVGAELCHDEGKVNPLIANSAMRRLLKEAGVAFHNVEAHGLETDGALVRIVHSAGTHSADRVILATAWGTRALTEALGGSLPTAWEPLHMNITEPADYAIEHLVQHAERPITLKQFRSGQIVIGGGWEARYDPARGNPDVLEDSALGNMALAARLVPRICNLRVIRTWAGLNTTADGKSIIGILKSAPSVCVAVPGDAGYTLGPLVGQIAADLVLKNPPAVDPQPFSPDRFLT